MKDEAKLMENDKFVLDRDKVIGSLSSARKEASNNFNKTQESLTNHLFTAATAYITIILAFVNIVHSYFESYSWIIAVSVIAFSASIVPWAVEKIVTSVVYWRDIKASRKLLDVAINEVEEENGLNILDKIAAKMLCGGRTSLIPIVLQVFLFLIGVLFAVIAVSLTLL